MLAHLELLTIKAISYSWVIFRTFHKFIANMLSGIIWIGKILSLFRISHHSFPSTRGYTLCCQGLSTCLDQQDADAFKEYN